ncbi:MAG TPA: ABC transporter substrate-binding protein [bacterium]|nr:ABC transporter substrate-binding protein [bacterium]
MRNRLLRLLGVLLALALLPAVVVGGPAPSRTPPNVLVIGTSIQDIVSLDPAQAFEFRSTWVVEHLYDTLVEFNREFNRALPNVAASWTASPDLKTYTFQLRSGVRFHSGNAVNAQAVEFSLRRVMRLKMSPAFIITDFVKAETDIAAVGSDQVRITFNQGMPEVLMASVLDNPVSSVVDPALVRRNAAAGDPEANKWLTENDAGSGPYILRRWTRNAIVELVAYDGYWRGRPSMGRIFIQDLIEPAAQLLALQRGDIDVAMSLLPGQYRQLATTPGFVVKRVPTFSIRYLAMNVGYEPFASRQVRNAVKYAVDYDAIKRIYEDAIDVGQTIVPARMFAHLPDRPYTRNVERARALMREAGREAGFRATLVVSTEVPLPDIAAKIKEDLAAINITVDVQVLRSADVLGIYRGRTHHMTIARWGADYPDPDNLAKAFADFDSRVLAWRNQWDHPVKRVVQQAVQESDRAKREALYKEIQKVVLEEGPYVIFAYPLRQIAMRTNVKGVDPSPLAETFDLTNASKE